MHYVADLHLHSKYSRAVSPQMTLPVMAEVAAQKGLDILTAADFTHPVWFKEIQGLLEEAEEGLYALRSENLPAGRQGGEVRSKKQVRFLLSTEISSIYKHNDKLRRIHNLIFAPSIQVAEKINQELLRRGANLSADGRPIIGLWSKNLLEMILSIDERCLLIPCHVWTPHFGIYGSASGYDSLEEAFGELVPHIYGIETGLSSDPDMNWQVKELMDRTILSFSDAHSAPKMGREATVFDLESPSYENIRRAIMRKGSNKIAYTVEFYPEEGKYHFSGHRNCKVVQGPEEIRVSGNICPTCRKRLTEGVLFRVQQLADAALRERVEEKANNDGVKWYTDKHKKQPPYIKLVPLNEIIAEAMHSTVASQKVKNLFARICQELTSEMHILLKAPIADIVKIGGDRVAAGVQKVREGKISINPGYDGEYGKVRIWNEEDEKKKVDESQLSLGF